MRALHIRTSKRPQNGLRRIIDANNRIHNIYQKLGVGSRPQLMNFVRTRIEGRD